MKRQIRFLLGLMAVLFTSFAYPSGDKKVADEAHKYPLLSQHSVYRDWLVAGDDEARMTILRKSIDGISCDPLICKNLQDRIKFTQELKKFLEEQKPLFDQDEFLEDEYPEVIARIEHDIKSGVAAQKRHAKRQQMPGALEEAIKLGDSKRVFEWLDKNPKDIAAMNEYGRNPLMVAVVQEPLNLAMIAELIKRTKDIDTQDDSKETALHLIAQSYDPRAAEVVQALLRAGAGVEMRDSDGYMPLAAAATQGNLPIVKILLPYTKKDINKTVAKSQNLLKQVIEHISRDRIDFEEQKKCPKCNRIHRSLSAKQELELLTFLIDNGAKMSAKDHPLFSVIRDGNEPVVRLLVERGADVNADLASKDYCNQFFQNDENEHCGAVRVALVYYDPITFGHKNARVQMIKFLLHQENLQNKQGAMETILKYARIDLPLAQAVIESGADAQTISKAIAALEREPNKSEEEKDVLEYLKKLPRQYNKRIQEAQKALSDLSNVVEDPGITAPEIAALLKGFNAGSTDPRVVTMNAIKRAIRGDYHSDFDKMISKDVAATLELADEAGDTPLLLAIKYNKRDAVATILTVIESSDEKTKEELLHTVLSHKNEQGFDAYHLAKKLGYKDIVDLLALYHKE